MSDALVAFLTARLDETERALTERRDRPPGWAHDGPCINYEGQDPEDYTIYDSCERHLAAAKHAEDEACAGRQPYADVDFGLRDVAAKRRLVGLYVASRDRDAWMRESTGSAPLAAATGAYLEAVKTLATIWSQHPDYDPAWAVRP